MSTTNIIDRLLIQIPHIVDGRIRDLGPMYAETDLGHFIVEPWNGFSSLTFLVPAIYWLYKFRGQYKEYQFYVYCSILLILGGLGSTIYHLFRYYPFFIFMDFVPILILTFSVAAFLWFKLLKNVTKVGAVTVFTFALHYTIHSKLPISTHAQINLGYFVTGTFFFLPALIILFQTQFTAFHLFTASLFFLILALICRIIDVYAEIPALPMGTHFLWHAFCAIGAFYLGEYIIQLTPQTNDRT